MCKIREQWGIALAAAAKNRELLLFLLLDFIFFLSGTVGHDPWWKKGENYSFGIIYNFYKTDTWLIPVNAAVPFMEKPPLYYWTARVLCDLLDSVLPLHDAARLASTIFLSISTFFVWLSGRTIFRLYPEKVSLFGWLCVLLFLGTYGTSISGHAMITDIALLAGTAITLYGLIAICKTPEKWISTGISLGAGGGIVFLSKGFILPVILSISAILISILSPQFKWQSSTIKALLLAIIIATPCFILWPLLVYQHDPALFLQWFWDNNIGRFLGHSVPELGAENRRDNFLLMLPVYAFPIFPLACFEIICGRKEWRRTEYLLPLIVSAVGLVILFSSASFRTIYMMPLFPGFTLLAAQGLMRLSPRFLANWNDFARVGFTSTGIAIWLIWLNLLYPVGHRPVPWLVKRWDHILPAEFMPHDPQILALIVSVTVTALWISSLRTRNDTPLATARIFFTGAVMLWCTSHTLLLPWLNETKSFRSVVESFEAFKKTTPYANACVAHYRLGENMAPMLEYFMHMDTPLPVINLDMDTCPLFLTFQLKNAPEDIDPRWKLIWRGSRLRDMKDSELRLYERVKQP